MSIQPEVMSSGQTSAESPEAVDDDRASAMLLSLVSAHAEYIKAVKLALKAKTGLSDLPEQAVYYDQYRVVLAALTETQRSSSGARSDEKEDVMSIPTNPAEPDRDGQARFEEHCKAARPWMSLAYEYMNEKSRRYDSPFTAHAWWGWQAALVAPKLEGAQAKPAEAAPFREFALASFEHEEAHKTNDVTRTRKANARLLTARFSAKDALASPQPVLTDALALAIRFHETYERLAPSFGYETRPDTKVFDPESKNGKLMVAVCAALAPQLAAPPNAEAQPVTSDARTGLPLSWVAFCPHCERPLTITPKRAEQLALKEGGEE